MAYYQVLESYVPIIYKHYSTKQKRQAAAKRIGLALCDITKNKYGLVPHIDPTHGPLELKHAWYSVPLHAELRTYTSSAASAEDWHYDGDTTDGADPNCAMVVWVSVEPTLIKTPDGKIFQPPPWQIVIFKNRDVLHRRPSNCPKHRWMFRQRVAVPEWL